MRVPRALQELGLRLSATVGDLTNELGRSPTVAEIAERLEVDPEAVLEAMEANRAFATQSSTPSFPATTARSATRSAARPGMDQIEHEMVVNDLLATLPEREQTILRLRFFDGLTQTEIAAQVGISQMHVSRLLASLAFDAPGRPKALEAGTDSFLASPPGRGGGSDPAFRPFGSCTPARPLSCSLAHDLGVSSSTSATLASSSVGPIRLMRSVGLFALGGSGLGTRLRAVSHGDGSMGFEGSDDESLLATLLQSAALWRAACARAAASSSSGADRGRSLLTITQVTTLRY